MARPYATPDVFRAIAHPIRREILLTLRKQGELSAGAIADRLPIAWTTVSQHLQILRIAGLRRGRELHYRVNHQPLDKASTFFKDMQTSKSRR